MADAQRHTFRDHDNVPGVCWRMIAGTNNVCGRGLGDAVHQPIGIGQTARMSKGTMPRSLRIPPDLWNAAVAKAAEDGTTVTAVVVAALREYVSQEARGSVTA